MFDSKSWTYLGKHLMTPWEWAVAVGVLVGLIWLVSRVMSYFREDADDADHSLEMLTDFRALHQQGGLSDDEFRLIRSRLANAAQAASVAERINQKAKSSNHGSKNPADQPNDTSTESTATHATAENEANSVGMTEDEKDEESQG